MRRRRTQPLDRTPSHRFRVRITLLMADAYLAADVAKPLECAVASRVIGSMGEHTVCMMHVDHVTMAPWAGSRYMTH